MDEFCPPQNSPPALPVVEMAMSKEAIEKHIADATARAFFEGVAVGVKHAQNARRLAIECQDARSFEAVPTVPSSSAATDGAVSGGGSWNPFCYFSS
jgi:hypothetical protein